VFLAMGGIALGRGVTSSGLLESMDRVIRGLVDGLSLYAVVLVLSAVVLVSAHSTFSLGPAADAHPGRLDVHQPHDRGRPARADRGRAREEPPGRARAAAHLSHRPHLLDGHGHARLGVPEPDRVRVFPLRAGPRTGVDGVDRSAAQEDEVGQLYLSNVDFLKNGVPASVLATLVVATVGFLLMRLIGCVRGGRARRVPSLTCVCVGCSTG
jgi:phosphate transporter